MDLNGLRRLPAMWAAVGVHGGSLGKAPEPVYARRASRILALCFMTSLLLLLCGAGSASAHSNYIFTGSFGTSGAGAGQLSLTAGSGVVVNSETHDVYVADTGNNRVDEFEADGKFVRAWGWGVASGAAESQTCTVSCEQGLSGSAPGEFEGPVSIAIDNAPGGNGDIYVADVGEPGESPANVVSKFNPDGGLVESWGVKGQLHGSATSAFGQIFGIGVDPSGSLWVSGLERMDEFSRSGSSTQSLKVLYVTLAEIVFDSSSDLYAQSPYGSGATALLYSAGEGGVDEHLMAGAYEQLTSSLSVTGIAIDRTSDDIYVDVGSSVERFVSGCQIVRPVAEGCVPLESFGSPDVEGGGGLAVDSSTGIVYVVKPGTDGVDVFAPEVPRPPVIEGESVSAVTSDYAAFAIKVNPNGPVTSYRLEYGQTASYGQSAPVPDGLVGAGFEAQEVSLHVSGLMAQTTYHFRVVAHNSKGTVYSEDDTFTTQAAHGSFALADGRQWEMVSPPQKFGALIEGSGPDAHLMQASAAGDAIAYRASSPTENEPHGYPGTQMVLSAHTSTGWSSQDISPPHDHPPNITQSDGEEFSIFSEDLSRAALQPTDSSLTLLSPEASESTPYLRSDFLGGNAEDLCTAYCYRPLVTGKAGFANVPTGTVFGEEPTGRCEETDGECGPKFQGASPDLSHIVLSSSAQLTSTPAPAGAPGLYEWSEGSLQLIDLLPPGEAGPVFLAGTSEGDPLGVRHSISDDGQRVILEREGPRPELQPPFATGLYLRDLAAGETIRLDLPQGGSGSGVVTYMDASSDASRIFFLDTGPLMADSSPGGEDLYEYNLNAPAGSRLTDLTVAPDAGKSAGVHMMLGASEDDSYVYFAAAGALTPGAVEGECPYTLATAGGGICNIYVRHEGVTRLVAALPSREIYDWSASLHSEGYNSGLYARVSPNGQWLAFVSSAELTGYDTHDAVSGQPDLEAYLYHAPGGIGAGSLICASCNPTGARPVGESQESDTKPEDGGTFSVQRVAGSVSPWTGIINSETFAVHQPRYLSDSGRLFFDSTDALVPQDVDGVEDVYEYEPQGVPAGEHACSSASTSGSVVFKPARSFEVAGRVEEESAGCVGLISSGTSSERSWFLDASESGGDVFFITAARLASQDEDTADDVYDAHECTSSSPCTPVVTPPPPCETEASCKAAPEPQPTLYGAPSSATFSGAGNIAPGPAAPSPPKKVTKKTVKCKKGFVKNKKNKCVKQPKKKKTKAKKATNDRRVSR